jgi:hypothetical protein
MAESNLPPLAILPSTLASNRKITKNDWQTAVVLASRWNAKTGRCDPGLPTLCRDTGLHKRNQRRSLDHLEALGLIAIVSRTNKHGATISNQYDLKFMNGVREIGGVRENDGVHQTSAGDVHQTSAGDVHQSGAGDVHQTSAPNKEDNKEDNSETNVLDFKGSSAKKPRQKKISSNGTRIDPDWRPTKANIKYARDKGYSDLEISNLAEAFHDHWQAKSGATAIKSDWSAAWRTWTRNDIKFNGLPKSKMNGGQ